ncbi:hypothetical protein [Miltoncostaea oceani]|uniref:hypothetical protein n=1 Tax=Miltoncostaea oceani TaxID=2843216 RepID=UPI001C3E068C|nr:hypothetical protein [Miltoncostaea oceani]
MSDESFPSLATSPAALEIPQALLPRATDSEVARRATALADRVAGYGASERLDGRFRLAVGDLGRAVTGLEGMRACGLAPSVADEALPRLAEVVDAVERALERAIPDLQAEQQNAESVRAPVRRPRKVRAAVPK